MHRMTDTRHIARRGLQLALGAALVLYGIAGFPSPVTQPQQAVACPDSMAPGMSCTTVNGNEVWTIDQGDGTSTSTTYSGSDLNAPTSVVTTDRQTGRTSTTTYSGIGRRRTATTTSSYRGRTTTTVCFRGGYCTTTTVPTSTIANSQDAPTTDILQNFRDYDGENGRDGEAGIEALKEWYDAREGRDLDDVNTIDRAALDYAQCVSWGLPCTIDMTEDQVFDITKREGVTLGKNDGQLHGEEATTNFQNSIWFDRCPKSRCGQGFIPPGGHSNNRVNTFNNGGNGPTCHNGLTVMAAFIDSSTSDDGCRPPSCDFGRGSDGWCLPPGNSDPPVIYVVGPRDVDEDDGRATFRVVLSHAIPQPVSVTVYTRGGTASSAQGDFTAVNRRVTIRGSTTIEWVHVTILDDTHDEPDETFTLHMSAPSSNAELSARTSAEATIVDNDDPAAPGAPQNLLLVCSVSNSGATLTASWDPPSGNPPASRYETSFSSSDPGDVMSPTDEFYNNRILTNGSPFIHSEDRDQDGLPDTGAEVQVSGRVVGFEVVGGVHH